MAKESVRGPSRTKDYEPGSWIIEPSGRWRVWAGCAGVFLAGMATMCALLATITPH